MNSFVKNNSLLVGSQKEQSDFPHDPNNVVLVFDTSMQTENLTISVPIQGATPNCTINWGDGSSESHTTTGNKNHTYSSAGIYVVQISGTLRHLSFGSVNNTKLKLVRCLSFGNVGLTNLAGGFQSCSNLIECPTILPPGVTLLNGCFQQCSSFNDARISSWNTTNVIDMRSMFRSAYSFNQNIENWNTTKVTNMDIMFREAVLFNQPIGSWNTENVTIMSGMFLFASSFNQPIGNWNTTKVTTMFTMFRDASSFNQPIGGWNTENVKTMHSMFERASSFNQAIGSWNTQNVTNMNFMFVGASSFAQDISNWDIRKITTMSGMFTGSSWGTANYDAVLEDWANLSDNDLKSQAITSFATLSGGSQTRVTSNNHGMVSGSRVNISGTTNYNGDYNVVSASANTFDIGIPFIVNDATGTMNHRRSRNVVAGFGTNKYNSGIPATSRNVLTTTYNWTITDGGQV